MLLYLAPRHLLLVSNYFIGVIMLTLPLEPTDDRAAPAFKNTAECARWLEQLQLTNLQLAHSKLLIQINELNRYPLRSHDRLVILEMLRETVAHVQMDYAKKLIAKPLLLTDAEYMIFVAIVHLWQAMVTGYQRCLQDFISGDKSIELQGALLCQRCLLYSGLEIFEHLRTGYEFNPNLWHQLHNLYEFTENRGLHQVEVADLLNTAHIQTNCRNIYVKTLLACDAHPAELTRSQLRLLDGWLSTWSEEIRLERHYSISPGDALPLAIDLNSTQGVQSATHLRDNPQIRYLALVPLSKLLRVKIILLEQGATTEKVGLGKLSSTEECVELLNFLHKCWCESHSESVRNRKMAQSAQICSHPELIFGQLTGKIFGQPNPQITAANRGALETFGNVSDKKVQGYQSPTLEAWLLESDSLLGAQLTRDALTGERLSRTQLLALHTGSEAHHFVLAVSTWLKVTRTGKLQIGVRYLPGKPEPIHIRPYGLNQHNEPYLPAFLLPAVRELNIPSSLILPPHFLQPKRVIEMLTLKGLKMTLQLGFGIEKGIDYERSSFEPIRV